MQQALRDCSPQAGTVLMLMSSHTNLYLLSALKGLDSDILLAVSKFGCLCLKSAPRFFNRRSEKIEMFKSKCVCGSTVITHKMINKSLPASLKIFKCTIDTQ